MSSISPVKYKINSAKKNFLARLFPQNYIFKEALECYLTRLPKDISVKWRRDERGFIVGKIIVNDNEFVTQGKDAKDFIEMVNDTIFSVYEIPTEYINKIGKNYFIPSVEQLEKLKDKSIKESFLGLEKQKQFA